MRVKNIDFCSFSSKNHFFSFFLYSRNKNWWFFNFWKFWKNIFFSFCWNAMRFIDFLKKILINHQKNLEKIKKKSFFKNSKTRDSIKKLIFLIVFQFSKIFEFFLLFFQNLKAFWKKLKKNLKNFENWKKIKKNQFFDYCLVFLNF